MKRTKQKVVASIALTSLAASLVGCQLGGDEMLPLGAGVGPGGTLNAMSAGNRTGARPRLSVKASQFKAQGVMPGEFIVKYKVGASPMRAMSGATVQNIGPAESRMKLVKYAQGGVSAQSAQAQMSSLSRDPSIEYVEPNGIISLNLPREQDATPPAAPTPAAYPDDPMFAQQYSHKVSNSQAGWNIQKGSENVVLAIVDTGVDVTHPDLAAKMLKGWNVVDNSDTMADPQGHGTHCAGIAAALTNNKTGVAGVAPNVKILPVRVLDDNGSGTYADVANGILWAADHGAHVISMSLGGPSSSKVIEDAVKHAISKDALLVAAMGNDGNGSKSYPAAIDGVMAIGSSDKNDKKSSFSQFGKWHSVIAPGSGILSTFPTHASGMPGTNYGSISGTSMATPFVAGLAALVRSQYPQLKRAEVKAHIEATSDDLGDKGYDIYYGFGRINVGKALATPPARR